MVCGVLFLIESSFILVSFAKIEQVCDLTPTVSLKLTLVALKQWDEDQDPRSPSEVWTSSSCPQVVGALKPDSSFHIMTNYPATREHRIWPKQNSEVSLGWGLRSKSYIYECTIIPCFKSRWHEYVHHIGKSCPRMRFREYFVCCDER